MGQGLHTKMVQVCSCLLEISPEKIHIVDTNSSAVPNASPTAASYSTDLYGMAVKVRCKFCMDLTGREGHFIVIPVTVVGTCCEIC